MRHYQPKACVGCGVEFQPAGPRSIRCDSCREEADAKQWAVEAARRKDARRLAKARHEDPPPKPAPPPVPEAVKERSKIEARIQAEINGGLLEQFVTRLAELETRVEVLEFDKGKVAD